MVQGGGREIKKTRAAAEVAAAEAFRTREKRARRLFDEWTGVTNPEIRSALWHNLSAEDRSHWCDRAEEELGKGSPRTPEAPSNQ